MPSPFENNPRHEPATEAKLAVLRRPETYPDRPTRVEVVETHMAWVFLIDREVYKLKKPVRYEYLDFSTIEARRRDCEEEVRLNRRLASDVYLGVVPLTVRGDGRIDLGGKGEPVDWLVRMRRLPQERMLDARIMAGRVEPADARRVGSLLARFYERARRVEMSPKAYRDRLVEQVETDREALIDPRYGLPNGVLHAVSDALLQWVRGTPEQLEQRAAEGRIVEGHGDLRPEHVCLIEPEPVIIDCIEFNRDFRILDPVSELAYLKLECERLGTGWVGRAVLEEYGRLSDDRPGDSLVRFYGAMHGCLRAKIAAWHLHEPDVADPEKWRRRAQQYLDRAAERMECLP